MDRTKPKVASTREVRSVVKDLSEEFLHCRDFGHTWTQFRVVRIKGGFQRSLYCKNCKANRHQMLSNRGDIVASHYEYPDGYQIKGLGRIQSNGRSILRLESVQRAVGSEAPLLDGLSPN